MKTKPYAFQKRGIALLDEFDGVALLADEMGLGKTLQALGYLELHHCELTPCVVVTPATLKAVWRREAWKHCRIRTAMACGQTPTHLVPKHGYPLIINYEIVTYWEQYIKKLQPKLLILDEVHYIKNGRAKRTKSIHRIARRIPHVIAISGTPLTSKPSDLFNVLKLLWPAHFNSFWKFAQRYCDMKVTPWGWDTNGASHLGELHRKLKHLGMIRRTKAQVLKQLPAKQRTILPFEIDNRKEYEMAERDLCTWLVAQYLEQGKEPPIHVKQTRYAAAVTKFAALRLLAVAGKMAAVYQWIDIALEDGADKLVVYAVHRRVVEMIQAKYKGTAVCIYGSTSIRQRRRNIQRFQTDPKVRIFVGNKAAIEGITLTAASRLAFAELFMTPGDHLQAEDRIHRIGQHKAANIYYLVAQDTVEEDMCRMLQGKDKNIRKVLDGSSVKGKLNLHDRLIRNLLYKLHNQLKH